MVFDKQDVVRAVKKLGQRGAYFQFRDLRKEMGVDPTGSARLYNYLNQLRIEGTVEVVSNEERKRNKYYSCKLAPPSMGTCREVDRLARIEEDLKHIKTGLDKLTAAWT